MVVDSIPANCAFYYRGGSTWSFEWQQALSWFPERRNVEHGKTYDFYMSPASLPLYSYDGLAVNVEEMWHIKGNRGHVVGTNVKTRLGLQPRQSGDVFYVFRKGDFIKDVAPQGNQSVASPQTHCSYPAFVHHQTFRIIRAPGICTIAMSVGQMEAHAANMNAAFTSQDVEAHGPTTATYHRRAVEDMSAVVQETGNGLLVSTNIFAGGY